MRTAVLGNRTFRRLFTAQVVALLGTGLLTVALGLLAYDIAGPQAGAVLGTALAIKMIAYVVVAPVISSIASGVSRRILLIGSDMVRGGVALLLPWVDQVWQIYILIFVLQAASATFTPAFQALIPRILVDDAQYTRGLSLSRMAYDLESLLSPVVAAALLTVVSYHSLFLGTVLGFTASALLVRTTVLPQAPALTVADFWARSTVGIRLMFARPVLRALLALNICVAAATALVVVNTVVYVHTGLGLSNTAVALLLACYGGGSMLVALILPLALSHFGDRMIMLTGALVISAGLAATGVLVVSASDSGVALAICWTILGAGTSLISTPTARVLREESVPEQQPALFTAQFSLSHACFFVTYPVAGWLGATVSQPIAVGVLCAVSVVAGLTAARCWPPRSATLPGHADTRLGVARAVVD